MPVLRAADKDEMTWGKRIEMKLRKYLDLRL